MSRKNLSRTVIEGGRSHRNIFDRRESHGVERAKVRVWLWKARLDVEEAEDSDPDPRPRVRKWFSDKLGPARRWLEHQVGRPWSKVYAELVTKFDTRTTAGRHIVEDHMLWWVRMGEQEGIHWRRHEFFVDARGILRTTRYYRPEWGQLRRATNAWTGGRKAILTHRGWWWLWIRPEGPRCSGWRCAVGSHKRLDDGWYYHSVKRVLDRAMSRGDIRQLLALPPELRDQIVTRGDE